MIILRSLGILLLIAFTTPSDASSQVIRSWTGYGGGPIVHTKHGIAEFGINGYHPVLEPLPLPTSRHKVTVKGKIYSVVVTPFPKPKAKPKATKKKTQPKPKKKKVQKPVNPKADIKKNPFFKG